MVQYLKITLFDLYVKFENLKSNFENDYSSSANPDEIVQQYLWDARNISDSITCTCIATDLWIDFFDMILPEAGNNSKVNCYILGLFNFQVCDKRYIRINCIANFEDIKYI